MDNTEQDQAEWMWGVFAVLMLILLVYLIRQFFQGGTFGQDHIRMDRKVVIITGANSGIGKETAMDLARRGAKVYLACRDFKRGEAARSEIVAKTGNKNIFNRQLDLASMDSIRRFVREFLSEETRLDVLINNAGVMMSSKVVTVDGFEKTIATNHMGPFLLTNLLIEILKKSAPSRIINIASLGHTFLSKLNRENLNSEKFFDGNRIYLETKLANVLFTRELARRLEGTGVTANSLHPGACKTELFRDVSCYWKCLFGPFVPLCFKSVEAAAQTHIQLAADPELESVTGKYFSDCKVKKESRAARSDEDALWLWNESAKWTDLEQA